MIELLNPPQIFSIEISPETWARIEPLIRLAASLDIRGKDSPLMRIQARAVHVDLWGVLNVIYPEIDGFHCRINAESKKIEVYGGIKI